MIEGLSSHPSQPARGELDNTMSIDPNDPRWPYVRDWKDGAEYDLKAVRVRQVSPGYLEIVAMESNNGTGRGGEQKLPYSPLRAISKTGRAGRPHPQVEALLSANR